MSKRKQSFVEGAFILTMAIAVAKVVGFLYRIPMNNIIEEDGLGFYSYAFNFYNTIYAIVVSGFPTAVAKIVAAYAAEGRYLDVKRTVRVSASFFALLGAVASVVVLLIARPYASLGDNEPAYYCILAFSPSLLFSCLMSTHRGYYQGMANMIPTAISQVVEVVFKALSGLAGAYLIKAHFAEEYASFGTVFGTAMADASSASVTISALSAAGAMLGVTVSTLAGYLYFFVRRWRWGDGITKAQRNASPPPESKRIILHKILRVGFPIALSSAAVALTGLIDNLSVLDRLALCLQQDPAAMFASHGGLLEQANRSFADIPNYLYGVYNIGMPLFNLVPTITGAFGMSALPHVTAAWQSGDRLGTRRNIEATLKLTVLVAAPAGFGIAALAGPIARMLFASRKIGAELTIPMLMILGIAAIFVGINGPVSSLLQAVGRVDVPVKLMIFGGLIKLASNYFLVAVPSLNIKAAPIGNLLCYLIISVLGIGILLRSTGIRINILNTLIKPLFAGLFTGVFALLGYNLVALTGRTMVATVAGILVAMVVYVFLLGLLRLLTREEVLSIPGGKKLAAILEKLHVLR